MKFEWPPVAKEKPMPYKDAEAFVIGEIEKRGLLKKVREAYRDAHADALAASKVSKFNPNPHVEEGQNLFNNPLAQEALRLRELRDVVKHLSKKAASGEDWHIPTKRHTSEGDAPVHRKFDKLVSDTVLGSDRTASMTQKNYERLLDDLEKHVQYFKDLSAVPDNAFLDEYPEIAQMLPHTQKREARLKELERREKEQENAAKKVGRAARRPREAKQKPPKKPEKVKDVDQRPPVRDRRLDAPSADENVTLGGVGVAQEEPMPGAALRGPEPERETAAPPTPETVAPVAGEAASQTETRPAPFERHVKGPLNREQARKALLEVVQNYVNADGGLEKDTTAETALLAAAKVVLEAYEKQPGADYEADQYNLIGNLEQWRAQRRALKSKRAEEQKPAPAPVEKTQAQKDQEQREKDKREEAFWRRARKTERELRQGGYIDNEGKLTLKNQNNQRWKKALALILGLGVLYAETEVYTRTVLEESPIDTAQRAYDAAMGRAPTVSPEDRQPVRTDGPRTTGVGDEQSTERGREGYRGEFEPDPNAPIAPTRFEPASAPDRNVERDS